MKQLILLLLWALTAMATADEKYLDNLLHEGNNILTSKMFSQVANANAGKSFVLSAYSVMTPLAQLSLASVDEAHDELLHAIGMPNDDIMKEVFTQVNKKLRSTKGITLKTASKVYVAKRYKLNSTFAAVTRNAFESEVQNIDFLKNIDAAKEVNAWVEEQTNNHIKDLVDPEILTEDTRALLVNAIYFKGIWKMQFEKDLTQDRDFFVNKTFTTKVSMMSRNSEYNYTRSRTLKSQIIEIPYEGDESSFIIVLPDEIEGIVEVTNILKDSTALENALKSMYEREVEMSIPKFKIDTTTDLKVILKKINITKMFDERTAKLDNLIDSLKDLRIDSATQKAFIEINEEGAEAAAANVFAVSYVDSLDIIPSRTQFIADHPFLFFLRARGNTLFSGVYYS